MFTNVSLFVSFNNGPSVHFQTQTIYVRTISIKRKINVYRVSKCSKSTAKHLRGETAMVKPFLVSFHHLNLSHSVSFHSVWLMFPLSSPLPLTPAPPLPSCFAVRSADQFQSGSMGDPHFGYLVLLTSHLPPPPHLPIYSPLEHMAGWVAWTRRDFNKYLSVLVSSWQGSRDGYSVRIRVCNKATGRGQCVCFCLFLDDSTFTSTTQMHAACYHRGRMCGCIHVACMNLSLWQRLIIFNPGGILLKWKAAFQFYNPVDLISPPAPVHTVQLDGQDWPDESCSPQTHLQCLPLLCQNKCPMLWESSSDLHQVLQKCAVRKKLRRQPTCFHCSLGLVNRALIGLGLNVCAWV